MLIAIGANYNTENRKAAWDTQTALPNVPLAGGSLHGNLLGLRDRLRVTVAVPIPVAVAVAIAVPGDRRADLDELRGRLLEHHLLIELARLLGFPGQLPPLLLFLGSGHRNIVLALADPGSVLGIDKERVLVSLEAHALALGVDLVLAVRLVPLGDGGVLVHVLDNLPPADARVIGAEGDFALLRRIGDDAHFGAAEVVIEQVLEPHAGDKEEVPGVGAALEGILVGALRARVAVLLLRLLVAGEGERLVKLLQQVDQGKRGRRLEGPVVLEQRQAHHEVRGPLAAPGVGDLVDVGDEAGDIEELGDRRPLLVLLIDHQRRAHAAVGVAAAAYLAPLRLGSVDQVGEVGEGAHQRDGKPVARGLGDAHLPLHIGSHVRERIALPQTALRRDVLVAAGERYRLERDEGDLLGVLAGEVDDGSYLVVVHSVDERRDQDDLDARLVHVLDGAQFHVKQVTHLAVAVGVVAHAVELQVGVPQSSFKGAAAEFLALRELDAVGGRLHAVVAQLAAVPDGVDEIGRHRGLAARELYRHLAARLDLDGVIENLFDVFPGEFVDESDLVRVHEAGVAHHVAAVGEVDGQDRAASVLDGARAVIVESFVVVGPDVAAGEVLLDPGEKLRVDSHHVLVMAVDGAIFHHPDLAVPLDDLSLDLSDFLVEERLPVLVAAQNPLPRFFDAAWTERIGFARPS